MHSKEYLVKTNPLKKNLKVVEDINLKYTLFLNMAAPIATTNVINVKQQLNGIDVPNNIIDDNINKYQFNNITDTQLSQAIALVSLLDYYGTYNGDRNTKIKILQTASSLIQKLLTTLGSTPGINNVSLTIIPGQPDLTGLLTNAMMEVDTEMKTLLQKNKLADTKSAVESKKLGTNSHTIPPPDTIVFRDGICAGEGCFYTSDKFNDNMSDIKNHLIDNILLNTLNGDPIPIDIQVFKQLELFKKPYISYKVFGISNPNTKKIIQDLNDALKDEFNDKTTYRLETIQETPNVYGFTINLKSNNITTVTLNEKHKGLKTLEVLFQYTCDKDLSKLTAEDKSNINIDSQFSKLFYTLEKLHGKNIVHLDIKLQNIMYCNGTFRFIDFAIGKLDENTDNFITTYHISTNNRLDYTQYIMETWMKLDKDKRKQLIPLALPIFKLTDLFCLLFAYLSMMNDTEINKYLKRVVTDDDSKVKGNTIIDIDDLYKNQLQNSSQGSILYNFKQQINNAVKEFQYNERLIDELSLEKDKLNLTELIKLVGQAGGKSKKKKQRGGYSDKQLIESIRGVIIAKITESSNTLSEPPIDNIIIQNYLNSIKEDFRNNDKNANVVINYVAYRYLANNYIPIALNSIEDNGNPKEAFKQQLELVKSMAGLLGLVNSDLISKNQVAASAEEELRKTQQTQDDVTDATKEMNDENDFITLTNQENVIINPYEKISSSNQQKTDIYTKQNNKSKKKVTWDSNVVGGSSKVQSFFNQYKNAFFVSPLKPPTTDKVIYVYRLDKLVSVTNRTLEVSRYKIDLEKNPTVSLKNLKSKKFQVALSKDIKRLKLEKNYLVPL
jgi:hypothetical protein